MHLSVIVGIFLLINPTLNIDSSPANYYRICTGKSSKLFHKDYENSSLYCRCLNSCRAVVKRLLTDEAKILRPDPCDFCFGHH